MSIELGENFNHFNVALITRHMQRCPAIRVALVKQSLCQLGVLLDQELVAGLIVALLGINPDVSQKSPLLFLILLSLGLYALLSQLLLNYDIRIKVVLL